MNDARERRGWWRRLRCAGTMAVLAAVACGSTVAAQDARGTIAGTVRDPSKSVVPGASVQVKHVEMGTAIAAVTNADGLFEVPYLIPGAYEVTVELSGFKRYVRQGVQLRVADRLQLDITLEVGGMAEEVMVTAATALLETTTASLGTVVDAKRISELPTPHGDPYALIGLAAGVSYTGSTAPSNRPTSSATRWTARAATAAT